MEFEKVIPLLKCNDMKESFSLYKVILDFEHIGTWQSTGSPSFSLIRKEDIDIQLSTHSGDGAVGNVVTIVVQGIDRLFQKFLARGLILLTKRNLQFTKGH